MVIKCVACERPIIDKYVLNVLERSWHQDCVQCSDCKIQLTDKCFSRDGKLYCRKDFFKRFATKCGGCGETLGWNEFVRRAKNNVYHLKCFTCMICRKQLATGEEFYVLDDNKFICKIDYLNNSKQAVLLSDQDVDDMESNYDETASQSSEKEIKREESPDNNNSTTSTTNTSPMNNLTDENCKEGMSLNGDDKLAACNDSQLGNSLEVGGGQKRRGPRTTIKAKQLETLKSAFAATPKPTRHIREQLAQETGLNMRVIQVWFQNRRSKERRMKQLSAMGARRHQFYSRPHRRGLRPLNGLDGLDDKIGVDQFYAFGAATPSDFYPYSYGEFFSHNNNNNNNNTENGHFPLSAVTSQANMDAIHGAGIAEHFINDAPPSSTSPEPNMPPFSRSEFPNTRPFNNSHVQGQQEMGETW